VRLAVVVTDSTVERKLIGSAAKTAEYKATFSDTSLVVKSRYCTCARRLSISLLRRNNQSKSCPCHNYSGFEEMNKLTLHPPIQNKMMSLLCFMLMVPFALPFSSSPSLSWRSSQEAKLSTLLQAQSRRDILVGAALMSQLVTPKTSGAADASVLSQIIAPQAASAALENGLLESRVLSNVLNPPPYGMEGTDVFYPS
jgi:hypothetical protein